MKLVEADAEAFKDEFRPHIAYVLSTKSKGRPADLCLQFIRLFLVKIPDAASIPEPVALLEEILLDLASWCEAPEKLTRQRVVALLAQVGPSPTAGILLQRLGTGPSPRLLRNFTSASDKVMDKSGNLILLVKHQVSKNILLLRGGR